MENLNKLSVYLLAADYKYDGLDKSSAWDQFILDQYLSPEINEDEFYNVFDAVKPRTLINLKFPVDFWPTHFDNLRRCLCEITKRDNGAFQLPPN